MIITIALLSVLVLAAILLIVALVFGHTHNKTLRSLFVALMIASIILGGFSLIAGGVYSGRVNELTTTYNDLTLYQPLVETTDNEYIRYDFYNKVNAYNEAYTEMVATSKDVWVGYLVNVHWSDDIAPIEFYLHGNHYYGN